MNTNAHTFEELKYILTNKLEKYLQKKYRE